MRTKSICQCNLILVTEGKINLLVTFIQRYVTQSKLSLMSTQMLLFPDKAAYLFSLTDMTHGNSKFNVTKLISFSKLIF